MSNEHWQRWVMQTARSWDDIAPIIKETGIAPVDHDHRQLAEYTLELNELLLDMENNFSLDNIKEQRALIDRFFEYMQTHFNREEGLIKKFNIPGLKQQQREHQKILKMIENIIFEFKTGRISSAFKVRLQLLDWLVNHVNSTDYETFDFLNICESILVVDNWDDISEFIRKVHVPPIDIEHKVLTESIMKTGRAIRNFQDNSISDGNVIFGYLEIVLSKAKSHFENEIEIITKFNISGEDIQHEQHNQFLSYIEGQIEILKNGRFDKLYELERELLFWWVKHINIHDYGTFVKANWFENVFSVSTCPEDVVWLINHTGIKKIDV